MSKKITQNELVIENPTQDFLLRFFVANLGLNFIWELLQTPLYRGPISNAEANVFVRLCLCLFAATIDIALISICYWAVSKLVHRWDWSLKFSLPWVYFILLLLLVGALIEYLAVYKFQWWGYTAAMPTIFCVGLFPLIQLAVVAAISKLLASVKKF